MDTVERAMLWLLWIVFIVERALPWWLDVFSE